MAAENEDTSAGACACQGRKAETGSVVLANAKLETETPHRGVKQRYPPEIQPLKRKPKKPERKKRSSHLADWLYFFECENDTSSYLMLQINDPFRKIQELGTGFFDFLT